MGVFVPFLIGSQMLIAVADSVPSFNLTPTCRSAAGAGITGSTSVEDDIDACMRDEQESRDAVTKEWGEFSADSKARCVRTSKGYNPSYVELRTCLEIARDAAKSPEETNPSKTQESSSQPPKTQESQPQPRPARTHPHHRVHQPPVRIRRHRSMHRWV